MILFNTKNLIVKSLKTADKTHFTELFSDEKILKLIPQNPYTESEINERFTKNLNLKLDTLKLEKCACAIFEKDNPELIGLALFLINEDNEKELGYRFREKYWGKGYATETTKGMLNFYFTILKVNKVVADANIENIGSIKVLSKFMNPVKEFFNERDKCTDRRFELYKKEWLKQNQ